MFKLFKNDTWLRPYLKHHAKALWWGLALGVLTTISSIGLMFVAGYLIDRSATRPPNILIVYVPVILAQAFGIGRPLFKYLEQLTAHNWVLKIISKLRRRLYLTLEQRANTVSEKSSLGQLLGILADDLEHLEDLYLKTIFPIFIADVIGIILIVILGIINWLYAIIMLISFLIILLAAPIISIIIFKTAQQHKKELVQKNYQKLTDATLGVGDWLVSGRQNDFIKEGTKYDSQLHTIQQHTKRFKWNRDLMLRILLGLIIVITLVWSNLTFNQNQAAANYTAAFVLGIFPLLDTFIPVSQAVEDLPIYQQSIVHLNRLPKLSNNSKASGNVPKSIQNIRMQRVSFQYPDDYQPILKDVSLNLNHGQKLAIIGPSGVGKTTLLQLLQGNLTPTCGHVQINHHDIQDWNLENDKWFSVLEQNPFIFNTSIINNVLIGNEQASIQDAKQALDEAGLTKYIKSLAHQYDTYIDESGVKLSGGQRQRLALARVLLQNNPIVLLDEPTMGLDPITENQIINTLQRVLKDKTVIWVTHHLQGLATVDQIIFLKDGRVQMTGSPHDLYQNSIKYRRLYQMDRGEIK